ncbi:MAG: calcium/sodium antiporter [Candidatus Scalindua rubra]|uniref:Ca2+/Na+ antiporter n=1 Tax=Candidatus Scalindua brodae TaxID=237368 RepID=A0A0B0ESL6_9BACT|nr:MAG: Ca2+/Na+ antiporter [Candidatus Scalindua brodae]MBZ0108212.1 calcium/sodium antiporter [Candidatus Scalindua rubra]TWU33476.1 Inner membrane protein YrbG [Candidatus Brocadiaceae bacterium S225]
MLLQSILFFVGITGVYFGAEWLVKGSSKLSRDLGIKPIVIGLTVVAFGTSSPEFAVSLTAAIKGSNDIAIGNIIGSNIANIGLILGIAAIVLPLEVEKVIMKRELPLMIGISAGLYLMAIDRKIGFIDGLLLFAGIILYIGYQIHNTLNYKKETRNSTGNTEDVPARASSVNSSCLQADSSIPDDKADRPESTNEEGQTRRHLLFNIVYIVIGLACLLVGSHILVKSAIFIAGSFGISEMVIGMTVVAFGTSVPEMATSVVSALRKEADICVGNVVGSNIFNILMVLGPVALVRPLNVARETLFFEFPVMLLFSIALIPMIRGNMRVNRLEGIVLVSGYFAFIFLLFR